MSTKFKVLLSALVVASFGSYAGVATFANFNAETTNPSNSVASGTLVLSNTKVSLAAAQELKKNLPRCRIVTDFTRKKGQEAAGYALIRVN